MLFLFNWGILVSKFVDSYSEKLWKHVLSLIIDLSVLATISCEQKNANVANETLLDQIRKAANLKPLVTGMILMAFFQGMDALKITWSFDSYNQLIVQSSSMGFEFSIKEDTKI